jgi:hypothetical protein
MTHRGSGGLKRSKNTFQDIEAPPVIEKNRIDEYVKDLLEIDGREGADEAKARDPEEEKEEGKPVGAKRKRRDGGAAAEGQIKRKTITYNRPPFVKCLESLQNFTFSELDELFSAALQEVYEARRMSPTRMVEDDLQFETDLLPFGVRHHRRAGKRDLL